jgi:hypothetical protein
MASISDDDDDEKKTIIDPPKTIITSPVSPSMMGLHGPSTTMISSLIEPIMPNKDDFISDIDFEYAMTKYNIEKDTFDLSKSAPSSLSLFHSKIPLTVATIPRPIEPNSDMYKTINDYNEAYKQYLEDLDEYDRKYGFTSSMVSAGLPYDSPEPVDPYYDVNNIPDFLFKESKKPNPKDYNNKISYIQDLQRYEQNRIDYLQAKDYYTNREGYGTAINEIIKNSKIKPTDKNIMKLSNSFFDELLKDSSLDLSDNRTINFIYQKIDKLPLDNKIKHIMKNDLKIMSGRGGINEDELKNVINPTNEFILSSYGVSPSDQTNFNKVLKNFFKLSEGMEIDVTDEKSLNEFKNYIEDNIENKEILTELDDYLENAKKYGSRIKKIEDMVPLQKFLLENKYSNISSNVKDKVKEFNNLLDKYTNIDNDNELDDFTTLMENRISNDQLDNFINGYVGMLKNIPPGSNIRENVAKNMSESIFNFLNEGNRDNLSLEDIDNASKIFLGDINKLISTIKTDNDRKITINSITEFLTDNIKNDTLKRIFYEYFNIFNRVDPKDYEKIISQINNEIRDNSLKLHPSKRLKNIERNINVTLGNQDILKIQDDFERLVNITQSNYDEIKNKLDDKKITDTGFKISITKVIRNKLLQNLKTNVIDKLTLDHTENLEIDKLFNSLMNTKNDFKIEDYKELSDKLENIINGYSTESFFIPIDKPIKKIEEPHELVPTKKSMKEFLEDIKIKLKSSEKIKKPEKGLFIDNVKDEHNIGDINIYTDDNGIKEIIIPYNVSHSDLAKICHALVNDPGLLVDINGSILTNIKNKSQYTNVFNLILGLVKKLERYANLYLIYRPDSKLTPYLGGSFTNHIYNKSDNHKILYNKFLNSGVHINTDHMIHKSIN